MSSDERAGHTRLCMMPQGPCYFLTCSCRCHDRELIAYAEKRYPGLYRPAKASETTCWGFEAGSTANGVCNLIWLAALAGAVIYAIVSLA